MLYEYLQECRHRFGRAPRKFTRAQKRELHVPKPLFLLINPRDRLWRLFWNLKRLWRDGEVVWAHIVQANELLFEPGPDNCPAEVVYSVKDSDRVTSGDLQEVARRLYALKHSTPDDPEFREVAEQLASERSRSFGVSVPEAIWPYAHLRRSVTFVCRDHVPNGQLLTGCLPVVAMRDEPHVVMPLPKQYWPDELIDWWVGSASAG